jgi:SpoIID/LytB domain protein
VIRPPRLLGAALALAVAGSLLMAGSLVVAPAVVADDAVPDPAAAPIDFPVIGAGFGHGVGMSQWGAYGMAKAGFDAAGIVTHYYSGTAVTAVQDDMEARINLLHQVSSAKVRSEPLDPTGGAIEVTVGPTVTLGGPTDEFRFDVAGALVAVTRVTGGQPTDLGTAATVTVRWAGTRAPGTAAGGPTLLDVVGSSSSLDSAGHRYRYGSLEVVPVSTSTGTRLNVVNSVRIHEEYLYGISEVSSSWPAAALQAQVLAARSYALSKVNRGVRQSCSCHMDDGGGPYFDQTFTGWGKASGALGDKWLEAVNGTLASDTTGLAITYNGQPISAFYSASSGGATRSSQEAWGGSLPYALSVPDPYIQTDANPYKSWTVTVSQAQMAKVFGVGVVLSVGVTERYESGALKTVSAVAADGSVVTRSGGQFQSALGLRSTYVLTISGNAGPPLPGAAPVAPPAAAPEQPAPAAVPPPVAAPAGPKVKPRTVSLISSMALTRRVGHGYRVTGVVRPAKPGLKVWRQLLTKGNWRTVQSTRTNAKGHYRFSVKKARHPGTTRTFRILVVRKGVVVGVSPPFTLTVKR